MAAICSRLDDIQRDVALAEEHDITTPNLPVLKEWCGGPLVDSEFNRQLEILRFDLDRDPLVIGQFGSDNRKWRIEAGGQPDASLFFDLTTSFGYVVGVSQPIPPQWRPEWHAWDHGQQDNYSQTFGASVDHIAGHRFVFTEGDGGLSLDEQIERISRVGLPTPTLIIHTGNKSGHFYWVLRDQITPARFTQMQKGIMKLLVGETDFEVDTSLSNPNRVMRAVGSIHPKTGRRCVIHTHNAGVSYDSDELQTFLPEVSARELSSVPAEATQWDAKDALELLSHIPNDVTTERLLQLELISYDFWLGIGMALHWAGCDCSDWIRWSETSDKHVDGACETKWESFDGDGAKTISYLRWLARELSGFELKFDPASLTSPFFVRGREKTAALAEKINAEKAAERARIAALPEWERDWCWVVQSRHTIESRIEKAFLRRGEFEEAPVIFLQNRFRRYDKSAGYYRHLDMSAIRLEISDMLKKAHQKIQDTKIYSFTTDQKSRNCEKWLATTLYKPDQSFRSSTEAIAFNNGTVYLRNGQWEFGEHSPANRLTHRIDADLQMGAECPVEFREFVRTSYGLKYLEIIRALVKYTADPRYRCQVMVHLLGRTGSGKGALLKVLEALVPAESRSSLSRFEEINSAEALNQKVMGKRMLVFPDVQGKQTGVTNLYKLLDANEWLTARALYNNETVNFRFDGRILLGSTSAIQLDHAGSGLMRRLLTVETLPQPLPSDILPQDRANSGRLENLLQSKLGEIVGWALALPDECVEKVLQKSDPEGLLRDSNIKVTASADSANCFIDSCLEPAEADVSPDLSELYCCYQLFCTHQGMRPLAAKNFKQRMTESLRHLFLPRRSAPGSSGSKKLPAKFFGFRLLPGLWTEQVGYDGVSVGPFIVTSSTRGTNLGGMDTQKLSEGAFEELSNHHPQQ